MLSHDEIMTLRNAANIIRKHVTDRCDTCDIHGPCKNTWIGLSEGCAMDCYCVFLESFIKTEVNNG